MLQGVILPRERCSAAERSGNPKRKPAISPLHRRSLIRDGSATVTRSDVIWRISRSLNGLNSSPWDWKDSL